MKFSKKLSMNTHNNYQSSIKNKSSVVKIDPYIFDFLKQIKLPVTTIDDLTKVDSKDIVVFVDYGPDNTEYETYGFYINELKNVRKLYNTLQQIKNQQNFKNGNISYKNRKDENQKKVFLPWLKSVKNTPGLIYVVAFDKRAENVETNSNFYKDKKDFIKEVSAFGLNTEGKEIYIYERLARTLCILPIIIPYFQEKHNLWLISDNDKLLDTPERQELFYTSVASTINEVTTLSKFGDIHVLTSIKKSTSEELNRVTEEFLSIADIAASSLGASLRINKKQRFVVPDIEAQEMLEEICKIPSINNQSLNLNSGCCLDLALFDFEKLNDSEEQARYYLKNITFQH